MPEETQQTTAAETATTTTGAETTQAAQTQQAAPDFEAWLSKQPDDVKKMYEDHTNGLKSALEKERKANKKRDDEAVRIAKEAEDAKLDAQQRLQKKLDAVQAERDQYAKQVKMIAARDALLVAAEKAKITFASQLAQQDALRLALEAAEIADDGSVANADAVWKSVIKDRDYLVKPVAQTVTTNAAARGQSSGNTIDDVRANALRARYRIHS